MALDDDDRRTIEKLQAKLSSAVAEARKWQAAINSIYEAAGEAAPYDLQDEGSANRTAEGHSLPEKRKASPDAGGGPVTGDAAPGQPEINESPLDTPAP